MVLDASALLAFLHDEPGADRVRAALDSALVSAVNWAEVIQKSLWRQVDVLGMRDDIAEVGVIFEPFTALQAETAAHLWEKSRKQRLSLADRACFALAIERQATVLTADQAWTDLKLDIDIQLVR